MIRIILLLIVTKPALCALPVCRGYAHTIAGTFRQAGDALSLSIHRIALLQNFGNFSSVGYFMTLLLRYWTVQCMQLACYFSLSALDSEVKRVPIAGPI